jgi:hypothetical protein
MARHVEGDVDDLVLFEERPQDRERAGRAHESDAMCRQAPAPAHEAPSPVVWGGLREEPRIHHPIGGRTKRGDDRRGRVVGPQVTVAEQDSSVTRQGSTEMRERLLVAARRSPRLSEEGCLDRALNEIRLRQRLKLVEPCGAGDDHLQSGACAVTFLRGSVPERCSLLRRSAHREPRRHQTAQHDRGSHADGEIRRRHGTRLKRPSRRCERDGRIGGLLRGHCSGCKHVGFIRAIGL